MKTFKIVGNDISDGYHTFDELYDHRVLIYINLCLLMKDKAAWRPDFEGWYCLYLDLNGAQISYHCPNKTLSLIEGKITRNDQMVFDGHQGSDVIYRLEEFAKGVK